MRSTSPIRGQPNRCRRRRLLGRDDRGAIDVAIVMVFPALLVMVFGLVQFSLHYHAQGIVNAAAQDALRETQNYGAATGAGEAAAWSMLEPSTDSGLLRDVTVTITDDGTTVTATVTAQVSTVVALPGLAFDVHASMSGPKESFAP